MRVETPYWGLVGAALVGVGGLAVFLGLTGGDIHVGPMAISGAYSLWRGTIVFAAGGILLKGATGGLVDREDEALVFMGSLMVWIVGGTEILSIVLEAIPGGPDVWIADVSTFVLAVGPPYQPAVLALLVTLPAFRYAEDDIRTIIGRIFGRKQ